MTQAADPTFYDEFDDLRNWIIHVVPDSPNDEYQFYTDRTKNVRVEHGYLKESEIRLKVDHLSCKSVDTSLLANPAS